MEQQFQLPPVHPPRLIHRFYLEPGEGVIKETKATAWFFLPGPVFLTLISSFLLYAAWAPHFGLPGIPYLTSFFETYTYAIPVFGTVWVLLFAITTFIVLLFLAVRAFLWGREIYAITPRRVVLQKGIVSREFEQIPIPQIRGVMVRQKVWGRLLRYGTVVITAEGDAQKGIGQEEWDGIPQAYLWPRLIDAVTEARNQASLNQAASAAVTAAERTGVVEGPPPPLPTPPAPPLKPKE